MKINKNMSSNKKEEKGKEEKQKEIKKEENENNKNKEDDINNDYPKEKINKINEFKNFDVIDHFKQNIIHFNKNCTEQIKDLSFYCFTCKHSVCNDCGAYDHKDHILIQRTNCLNYDNSFFNEISKVIERGINIDSQKTQIKKNISKSISQLKEQLDLLEKEKIKEVDNIFKEIKSNYVELKENYLKTKECIENYYKVNKKFFNIKIKRTKQNNNSNKIEDLIKPKNNENNENNDKTNNSNKENINIKTSVINYYNINDNDIGPNKDLENTVFLMNFELMNLCDNKNIQILEISNNINNKIKDMSKLIEENTKSFKEQIKNNYLPFDNDIITKFDDFYWDIKLRCEKYTEHISTFQSTIFDIYKRNGCLDKLKDLLSLFDSKNNKGKDVLFNQQFFIKMNDLSCLKTDIVKSLAKKLYVSNGKVRTTSKSRISSKSRFPPSLSQTDKKDDTIRKINKSINKTKSNNIIANKTHGEKLNTNVNNNNNEGETNTNTNTKQEMKKNPTNVGVKANIIIPKKESIVLNQRIIQRFYAYSVLEFYTKYFKDNRDNPDTELDEENNIYINKNNNDQDKICKTRTNNSKSSKNTIKTKNTNNIPLNKNANKNINDGNSNTNTGTNNNNLADIKNIKSRLKSNIRSVSLLSNYTERYTELKEKVKPVINTNYIQLFDPATTKITKIKVPLTKEEHGYTTFPDGCRHLLIDSDLYITGGTDNCGYPINIVLMYNLAIGELTRLANLNDNHSYHSVEYLENFDSIIVIGGENSSSCEIMDLDSKKWTKLPSLNYPRANSNIYYNNNTSDLFVLFGMEGEMTQKTKNTDVIEVLELNDIISGWMMVDYYKSVGLDLKSKYCITLPFTRDKLLVYGGSSARSLEKRLFALFDMIKNECIKVDSETMDLIKREENKIRAFDNALEKIK